MDWFEILECSDLQQIKENQRKQLFELLNIQDDGRQNAAMTKEELTNFCIGKKVNTNKFVPKHSIRIYAEFLEYDDEVICYCLDDGEIYNNYYSIGD